MGNGCGSETESQVLDADNNPVISVPHCMGCLDDPAAEVDKWHELAEKDVQKQKNSCGGTGEITPSMVSGVGNELPEKDGHEHSSGDCHSQFPGRFSYICRSP